MDLRLLVGVYSVRDVDLRKVAQGLEVKEVGNFGCGFEVVVGKPTGYLVERGIDFWMWI